MVKNCLFWLSISKRERKKSEGFFSWIDFEESSVTSSRSSFSDRFMFQNFNWCRLICDLLQTGNDWWFKSCEPFNHLRLIFHKELFSLFTDQVLQLFILEPSFLSNPFSSHLHHHIVLMHGIPFLYIMYSITFVQNPVSLKWWTTNVRQPWPFQMVHSRKHFQNAAKGFLVQTACLGFRSFHARGFWQTGKKEHALFQLTWENVWRG